MLIEATDLEYRVGAATLVSGVDIEVAVGELVAVVGPNGAGKSTLVKLLAGDLAPTGGSVALAGEQLSAIPSTELALLRSVLPPQQVRDVPFTTQAVVAMGRYPHRLDPANSRQKDVSAIRDALQRTDATHLAGRVVATLSGGERTRIAFARVLAQAAPIVLLDEPTTALDVAHQERIMTQTLAEARSARAVLAVLHDLNAAAYYADRVVLMADGHVESEGPPRVVLQEEVLSRVYGQAMRVQEHPFRNCPLVLVAD